MTQGVDPSKVIRKLSSRIADEIMTRTINEVALEDALDTVSAYEAAAQESAARGDSAAENPIAGEVIDGPHADPDAG